MAAILLVEDDPEICALLAEVLERAGHEVVVQSSIAAARDYIEGWSQQPDALICDWNLKDGTASELLEELTARNVKVPVLILTGYPIDQVKATGQSLECKFLQKPFSIGTLYKILKEMIPNNSRDQTFVASEEETTK